MSAWKRETATLVDGSGLYSPQALWTQARERLDVVTVVCSNRVYAILKLELAMQRVGTPG